MSAISGDIIQDTIRLVDEGHEVVMVVNDHCMLPFDSVWLMRSTDISVGDVVLT